MLCFLNGALETPPKHNLFSEQECVTLFVISF